MNVTEVVDQPKRRKVLSLAKEPLSEAKPTPPQFVVGTEAVYMVWREGGDMPKRVYGPDEGQLAHSHARSLTEQHGGRFHVLRSWRVLAEKTA